MVAVTWKEITEGEGSGNILRSDLPQSQVCPNIEDAIELLKHLKEGEVLNLTEVKIFNLTEQIFGAM